MKLLISIVQDADVNFLMDALTENGYRVTRLSTTGGFLKKGNTTLLIGVEEEQLDQVLDIIESNCKRRNTTTTIINPSAESSLLTNTVPVDITVGGATIFILDVDQYIRL
ncbi:cyclic-di-AMP receptor [uncultured Anaerococcus sp.]|uniref:cyclic-di-AMP receptor n=1 Tax=uncultured Anaerococcus sp. TaxID=293428 RepID=UPI00262032CB|nr:cyclic-di-AMP receptor [uncultured Anaerococcus sp.]